MRRPPIRGFLVHMLIDFRTGIRNRDLLLLNYLFPLGFFVMMGLIMPPINPLFVPTMVPSMVFFAVLVSTVLGMPNPLVEHREKGVFRCYKINGIPSSSILMVSAFTTSLHAAIVSVIVASVSVMVFGGPEPASWGAFVILTLSFIFACAGLAALIGVISANSRVTMLWSQLIFLPSMVIGGLTVPWDLLPGGLRRVSLLLPTTHAMRAYQLFAQQETRTGGAYVPILVLLVGGLGACFLANLMFSWDDKSSDRKVPSVLALVAMAPYAVGMVIY